jgi:hypothetical protein
MASMTSRAELNLVNANAPPSQVHSTEVSTISTVKYSHSI